MHYTPSPRDPKADPIRINLLSDTQTRPTQAMREAMARAEVGDEQIGADPTVNLLCERVADLLGKEAAVFMPSGTMCNVAATLAHCRPGDEILAHASAHIIAREGGAHAALGGFQITPLPGDDGQFAPEVFRAALHPRSRYQPPQTVVSVEQTANIGGGTIWKKAALDEVVSTASPTITPMRVPWRAGCRRSTASRCSSPRPIWCSSGPTAPASPAIKWSRPCASAACCSR